MAMKYRADINTREQLTESVEIVDFEYIYAPMEFLNSDTPEKPRIIAVLPVFLGEDELKIAEKLRELKSMGFRGALAHTLGHIELIKSAGLQAHGGFRLNITNSLSQRKYEELGLSDGIFSVEL
ncbi:MAG: U32 family peptidase, partial [Oscillospiraceae bacterium]|nr:U32 family peptidase [Oscillospiraceae bacterium]